ncbi:hypothetical protein Aple_017790 [Acrocarpospora pleiomorpha]|uniref:Uncharacterized protein n=1 Tax=Acrocarpospora pleiomorpha TaxID=90975 RepID=A0A5M3XCH6_9ACTN|nr:hypothetical protein [Acrocarpospora pleiomorpha]GES18884.1 hypothetical protein Aple_017790 [Acrocarpospora pleiomorpha]
MTEENGPAPAASDEDSGGEESLVKKIEREQQERRLRAETIGVGQNWYGGSEYRAEGGGTVFGAGRDLYVQQPEEEVFTIPIPAKSVECVRACFVGTASQRELVARLASGSVSLLRGEPRSGRATTATSAFLELGLTCHTLGAKDLKKVRPSHLRARHGYLVRADDATWHRHPETVLDQLRAVAVASDAVIIALVPPDCVVTKSVVMHEPPAAMDVFHKWITYLAEGLVGELQTHLQHLNEHIVGCRPSEAVEIAQQFAEGHRQGRALSDMIDNLPYAALTELEKNLEKHDAPSLARPFLISCSVLFGLPEAVVSDAALALAARIREEKQKEEDAEEERALQVWERLSQWIDYSRLSEAEGVRGGQGRRIDVRPGLATRLLPSLWAQLPAIRPALYDWLADLVEDEDWRVQVKAAYAIGRLATCDFELIDKRFFTPWSKERGKARVLTWALEAAALADRDVAVLVGRTLNAWASGTHNQRLAAALAYGSAIGVGHLEDALGAFHTIAVASPYLEICDAIARSVAEVYTTSTAQKVLRELARWTSGDASSEQVTAALAFVRLASMPHEDDTYPALRDHQPISDLAALWTNALSWGLSRMYGKTRIPAYAPTSWELMADWAHQAATDATADLIVENILVRATDRLRKSWMFHLHLWNKRGTITATHFARYLRLLKDN